MDRYIASQEEEADLMSRAFLNLKKKAQQTSEGAIKARLDALEARWSTIQTRHNQMKKVKSAEDESKPYFEEKFIEEYEEIYLTQKAQFLDALKALQPLPPPGNTEHVQSTERKATRKLPAISLPQFSGKYSDWSSFKDMFTAFMKHDSDLEDVERMYYLKSCLTGEAAELLKNIPVTGENYNRAWTLLQSHYENKRALTNLCIQTLLDLHPIQRESSDALRTLRNGTMDVIETLRTLGRPVDQMDDFFVNLTIRRFDASSRRDWELSVGDSTTPSTWEQLNTFLKSRIQALEMSAMQKPVAQASNPRAQKGAPPKRNSSSLTAHAVSKHGRRCSYCQGEHYISACDKFRACSCDNRHVFISEKQLCTNCLGPHRLSDCKSSGTCFNCQQRHHTLLHRSSRQPKQGTQRPQSYQPATPPQLDSRSAQASSGLPLSTSCPATPARFLDSANAQQQTTGATVHTVKAPPQPRSTRLLATARVFVTSERQRTSYARALLDPCSEATFISESLAQRIQAPRQSAHVLVSGVGAAPSYTVKTKTVIDISSHFSRDNHWKVTALVLPRLTEYVPSPPRILDACTFLAGLNLADPEMMSADQIDLIIGADAYPLIIQEGLRKSPDGELIAQATGLGWILTGSPSPKSHGSRPISSLPCVVTEDLSTILTRFWQQEEAVPDAPPILTQEERECEDHFVKTHRRNAEGRYVLRLPFNSNLAELGDSRHAAISALRRTELRLQRQPEFGEKYLKFMDEFYTLGHMREFTTFESAPTDSPSFILPHHGIFKVHGDTNKLRVVFNGSVKLPAGRSINECLHPGPKLQLDLFDVLLLWRIFRYVFSCDIEKMFRQILIDEQDQVFQQILWRSRATLRIFCLCTVTYGLASSPYQALRTLRQLAADEGHRFPLAAEVLVKQTYMDDIFAGADTLKEAAALKFELIKLLKAGGFPLGKWVANHPDVLADVPPEQQAVSRSFTWEQTETVPMLGVAWQPLLDAFCFHFNFTASASSVTKRSAASVVAQLYDPLGWITPVTISFKIFLQSLWHAGVEWDQVLPPHMKRQWDTHVEDLLHLQHFSMPRWIDTSKDIQFAELHGFCDASERAFAACVYLRTVDQAGSVNCLLLTSKSKVAPVQQVSLPRLELCGAVLLVRLAQRVRGLLSLKEARCHCWSDSTITLAWIREHPTAWKTYVANRVSEIQTTLPDASWQHITGTNNPADLPSRGITAAELAVSSFWLHGPSFLTETNAPWKSPGNCVEEDLPEELLESRGTSAHPAMATAAPQDPAFIARFSSLTRLVRRVASWFRPVLRARARITARKEKREITEEELSQFDCLTPARLLQGRRAVIYWIQSVYFSKEINYFLKNQSWPRKSAFLRLNPIRDDQGFIRVGGRLRHSILHPDEKHPLILPTGSHLTQLLILDAHEKTLHGGTQLTLNYLRQFVWIMRGRQLVKSHISHCLVCWRQRTRPATQLMGDLPSKRVQGFRSFLHSGVDYAGPIHLKFSKGRGATSYKGYISVFVCLSTRAVHLEAVSGYTTSDFLAAYKRFTARRGICATLTSDCGLNFIGANRELKLLFQQASARSEEIARLLAKDGTEWRFNPPGAPHFGGIWEAAVKSVKFHLKKVIGDFLLTFEEMTTLLAQIEATLNSRPLQAISDDPEDLSALTPGHFLIGEPLNTVPEPSTLDLSTSRLDRWQLLNNMREHFWKRWSEEYLRTLQQRPKWCNQETQVKVGDLCVIRNEQYPPSKWPLARVIKVHPGPDGMVRVVDLKTATSTYTRPLSKISLLPLKDDGSPISGEGGRNVRNSVELPLPPLD